MATKDVLFVYGTLRRGGGVPLATLLEREGEWLGAAVCPGHLYQISWYPAAVKSPPGESSPPLIQGDVFALEKESHVWAQLDAFEGFFPDHPERSEYQREFTEVVLGGGATRLKAWIYWYMRSAEGLKRIVSGDWLAHREAMEH